MALSMGDLLYIADVNNHSHSRGRSGRALSDDCGRQRRHGAQPDSVRRDHVPDPLGVALRSPWDVEFDDAGRLHIAMAGTHQLYIFEPETGMRFTHRSATGARPI